MSKYAVNEDGIQALHTVSNSMVEAVSEILNIANSMDRTASEKGEMLGPHKASLLSAIAEIKSAQKAATDPVSDISETLNEIADSYQEVIDNDRISSGTAAAKGAFGLSAVAGIVSSVADGQGEKYKARRRDGTLNSGVKNLGEAKNFGDLSSYMSQKYDIQLDSSVGNLHIDTVKSALGGAESVIAEYPDVGELLKMGITSSSGVMSCTGSKISFNPEYFKDNQTLKNDCQEMSKSGFWVKNSSPESIGAHEAAHGVEWALIQANPKYSSQADKVSAWNSCSEAGKIVSQACDNIKKTSYGSQKTPTELVQSISTYAMRDDSETMAEAFADVYANGVNANPLSKEIKRVTKELMDKYKGAY